MAVTTSFLAGNSNTCFTFLGLPLKIDFGPSGVHALPLAAGINVGGHYKGHFFLFSLSLSLSSSSGSLLILPEGVVIGIQIFAWAPK